jgi:hypothetical protein
MKANELRLGNLIIEDGKQTEFNGDFYHWCDDIMKPIKLTDELLLKFGFKKIGFKFIKDGIELLPIRDLYYRGKFPIKLDIKYVHQLQNLYFTLIGSELQYVA